MSGDLIDLGEDQCVGYFGIHCARSIQCKDGMFVVLRRGQVLHLLGIEGIYHRVAEVVIPCRHDADDELGEHLSERCGGATGQRQPVIALSSGFGGEQGILVFGIVTGADCMCITRRLQ